MAQGGSELWIEMIWFLYFWRKKYAARKIYKECSLEEVKLLEQSLGLDLPMQYKEFLLGIGNGAGKFFQGTDIFFICD